MKERLTAKKKINTVKTDTMRSRCMSERQCSSICSSQSQEEMVSTSAKIKPGFKGKLQEELLKIFLKHNNFLEEQKKNDTEQQGQSQEASLQHFIKDFEKIKKLSDMPVKKAKVEPNKNGENKGAASKQNAKHIQRPQTSKFKSQLKTGELRHQIIRDHLQSRN